MSRIIPQEEIAVLETLRGIADEHANNGDDRLVLLDLDPEKYPYQRLDNLEIRSQAGGPLTPEIASMLANDIEPRYPSLERLFNETHETTVGIQRIIELIKANNNVINGSDHAELMDIAFSHLALTGIIKRSGVNVRSGIVLSKMTDFLGYVGKDGESPTPLRDLLALGFDRCFLTIPRTKNTEGKFDEIEMARVNHKSRNHMKTALKRNSLLNKRQAPFLLGIALPGTRNKELTMPDGTTVSVVGKVSDGLLSFASTPNTEVVATSIRLHISEPRVFIDELPMPLKEHDDIIKLMGRLLTGIQLLDGKSYRYDEK